MLELTYFQKGFHFGKDGPGNRLIYHLAGCSLRCPWCANPECFAPDTKTTTQSLDAMEADIQRARPMFFSGGGVTFTGGEPTLQFEALRALLERLRARGIHTAIESNAAHPDLPSLFPLIDYLMLDLKFPDAAGYAAVGAADAEQILSNIRAAAESRQLALRIPLVNGYNTGGDAVDGFIDFLGRLSRRPDFTLELLPYHEYGRVKWGQHGMSYTVSDGFLTPEAFAAIGARFAKAGIPTIRT